MNTPEWINPHEDHHGIVKNLLRHCTKISVGLGGLSAVMDACDLEQLGEDNTVALVNLGCLIELVSGNLLDTVVRIENHVDQLANHS